MTQILRTGATAAGGAIVAVVALFGGTALAGTGVGAVFNLGQTNTVNAQSELTGSLNGVLFKVTNSNAGASSTALRLTVPSSRPPFVTNGTGKVVNLQADTVDGASANEISRVAAQSAAFALPFLEDGRTVLETLTINAPQQGFAVLSGNAMAYYSNGCALCMTHLRFHDVEANTDTVANVYEVQSTATFQWAPVAITVTVPVTAGTHTFQLVGTSWDGDGDADTTVPDLWYEQAATALYVRYNGVGTSLVSKPGPGAPAASAPSGAGVRH
jgi:hypothetical protein